MVVLLVSCLRDNSKFAIEAYELFRKIDVDGCVPNNCSYNTMIQGFLRNRDIVRAAQILH